MTIFTLGFVFISLFTVAIGAVAIFFLSFDAEPSANPVTPATTGLFNVVRQLNTQTIETVDSNGNVQHWQLSE